MNQSLKIFISVSVLLNLLLAGVIIGNIGHGLMGRSRHVTLQDITAGLSADRREHFKDTVSHTDQSLGALRQQLSDARKKAAGILKAEPFNKGAYLAQVQVIQQLKGQISQRITDAVVGLAGQTSPQERAAMADVIFPSN